MLTVPHATRFGTAHATKEIAKYEQEAHPKVGLGEMPLCLVRSYCQYTSPEKFEDAFDTAIDLCKQSRRMRHFRKFFRCYFRSEVDNDVISVSGMAVDCVDM